MFLLLIQQDHYLKGMLVRVQLGSYLGSQSKILLLDEPVSSLDIQSARDTMTDAIGKIKNNSAQGMIIVTHAHKPEMVNLAKTNFRRGKCRVYRFREVVYFN